MAEWLASTGYDKATHAVAQVLCYREFGDWRYDPGDQEYVRFWAAADHVMRAAVPHLPLSAPDQKRGDA